MYTRSGLRRPVVANLAVSRTRLESRGEGSAQLDAESVSVQAVADVLGVDRKAIRHHATDRGTLLRLMARTRLVIVLGVQVPGQLFLASCLSNFANNFVGALIGVSSLVEHLSLDNQLLALFGEPTETVMARLLSAGLGDETALRSLALLTNVCLAFARDSVVSANGERPRREMAKSALAGRVDTLLNFGRAVVRSCGRARSRYVRP